MAFPLVWEPSSMRVYRVPEVPIRAHDNAQSESIERWLNDHYERLLVGAKTGRSDRGEGDRVPLGTSTGFQVRST